VMSYLVERIQYGANHKKKKHMVEFMASAGQSNTGISRGENCDSAKLSYFGCEPVRKGPEIFDNMVCLCDQPEARTDNSFRQLIHLSQHHSLTAVRVRLKLASTTAKLDTRPL